MVPLLRLGKNIDCVPIIHGRCIFAQEVRRVFLSKDYPCVAVELPPSLGPTVLEAVQSLPLITAVVYQENSGEHCYVPVEPGEAIIEAMRLAQAERRVMEFVDWEMETFAFESQPLPDEYAITQMGLERYYADVLEEIPQAAPGSLQDQREIWMAAQLRDLSKNFRRVLFVCGMAHLEGIRHHYKAKTKASLPEKPEYKAQIYAVQSDSIYLLTGEIPYITHLYEKSRYDLDLKPFEKTDGVKQLLLETRKEYCRDFPEEEERLAPGALQTLLNYLRNLCLVQGYLTPSLYDLVVAAQGVGGGGFAARVVEMGKLYPYQDPLAPFPWIRMGFKEAYLEPEGEVKIKNRLPGPPFSLKNISLERRPRPEKKAEWKRHWGSHNECSWPEEDEKIENFTRHVKLRALGVLGEDLAKIEKFSSSIKDGLDIRETLRQWHTGNIYVKEMPPVRGDVGAVIFVFDADTDKYPWRTTWLAENANESTLCFYATDHNDDWVGPGISRAFYGGALFIFPPIIIPDIWKSKLFQNHENPVHLLVAAASYYSQSKYIAYVSANRPSLAERSIAQRENRHLIYLPISHFSAYTLRKLRKFHVLAGHEIRSFARKYIR